MSATGQNVMVIVILFLNAVIAAIYFILNRLIKLNKSESIFIKAVVMFLCPVIGPVFIGMSYLFFRIFFSEPVDLEDVVFSKEHTKFESKVEEEKEKNIIPLEEAIAITGKQDLRNLMMDVVSSDISSSLASITLALDSEDSETSHYAASVLQDALNGYRAEVETNYRKIIDNVPHREQIADYLCNYMDGILKQKVFIDMEQRYFVDIFDQVAEICFAEGIRYMTSDRMEKVALRLLEIKNYERCEVWCNRIVEMYPDTLAAYSTRLKLFFNSGRKDEFFEVINGLKKSNIVVDAETLELMRVFR